MAIKLTDDRENSKKYELLFQSIYDNYYSQLCFFARKYVNSDEEAEEIVQNMIVSLWSQKEKIAEIQSLRSYLFTSVKNLALNYLKHQKHIEDYKNFAIKELKEIELEKYEDIIDFDIKEKIDKSISDLPERCREVFELSRFDGLKYKEIADKLGITVKAVESNISRALNTLRKSMKYYLFIK